MKPNQFHFTLPTLALCCIAGCASTSGVWRFGRGVEISDPSLGALEKKIESEADPRPYRFAYTWQLIRNDELDRAVDTLADARDHRMDVRALSWMSLLRDEPAQMLEFANRALELSPTDPDAIYAAARAHYRLGQLGDASARIHEYLDLGITSRRGWVLRFLIEARSGRRDLAVETAEQIARNRFYYERRISPQDWLRLAGLYAGDREWTSSFDRLRALGELEAPVDKSALEASYPRATGGSLRRPLDERPYFGLNLDEESGAISTVHAGSIGEAAGLAAGDTLVAINELSIAEGGVPSFMENELNEGDIVRFSITRDGRGQTKEANATTWLYALDEATQALAKADQLFERGDEIHDGERLKRFAEAERLYRRAHALVRPKTTAILNAAIWARAKKGDQADALTELRQLVGCYPRTRV